MRNQFRPDSSPRWRRRGKLSEAGQSPTPSAVLPIICSSSAWWRPGPETQSEIDPVSDIVARCHLTQTYRRSPELFRCMRRELALLVRSEPCPSLEAADAHEG
jgi:hypothetical protein